MKFPFKKYVDDPSLSWEERYKRLEAHHVEETTFLIARIEKLEAPYERTPEEQEEYDKLLYEAINGFDIL